METYLSEKERIQKWKYTNEERILHQWNKKSFRIFLSITFIIWGLTLLYVLIYGFQESFQINILFIVFYPLFISYIGRRNRRKILQKRSKK